MARYLDEAAAAADGIVVVHEPELNRFALYLEGETERRLIGEATYSFPNETTVNFNHTVVDPKFRGTGLASVLARRAVTSYVTVGRTIEASCWFIAGYLKRHPEFLREPGSGETASD